MEGVGGIKCVCVCLCVSLCVCVCVCVCVCAYVSICLKFCPLLAQLTLCVCGCVILRVRAIQLTPLRLAPSADQLSVSGSAGRWTHTHSRARTHMHTHIHIQIHLQKHTIQSVIAFQSNLPPQARSYPPKLALSLCHTCTHALSHGQRAHTPPLFHRRPIVCNTCRARQSQEE